MGEKWAFRGAAPALAGAVLAGGMIVAAPAVTAAQAAGAAGAAGAAATVSTAATAGTAATVSTAGGPLNVRAGASTADTWVGALPHGVALQVACQVYGQLIAGSQRRTAYWDRLANGRYVSDGYVAWRPARPTVPWCGAGGATAATVRTGGGPLNVRAGASAATRRR